MKAAKNITASGQLGNEGRTRVCAISFAPVAAAGSISFKDGGSGGTERLKIDVGSGSTTYMNFPQDGVLFLADPYITLTTVTSLTIFYE